MQLPYRLAAAVSLLACFATACAREDDRSSRPVPAASDRAALVRESDLQPGPATAQIQVRNPYEGDPRMIAEGKRLYNWFNCVGCHFNGGGGMGPALIDEDWIYGHQPANIYESIVKGRPNGMPAFQGRLPDNDVWKLVAYVQALSQQAPEAKSGPGSALGNRALDQAAPEEDEEREGQ